MSRKYPTDQYIYKRASELPFGTAPSKRVAKAASMLESIADIADDDISVKLVNNDTEMEVEGVDKDTNYRLWQVMQVVADAYRLEQVEQVGETTYRIAPYAEEEDTA